MIADLVLRGGTICDGTGAAARTGDVAIVGGRILGTGRYDGATRREIDAAGLIVAPGFIDVHTHYDAQVTWDGLCTPSSWHGVTTVVIGNCGFALAPCRPSERDRLMRMLEHVEGMPYESLRAGISWEWESIPEYIGMLRASRLGPNVGVLLGHSAIRAHVLGDDAYERAATDAEIGTMRDLVRAGMAAGALGFATSRSPGHVGEGGRPVPSRLASREEIAALVGAMSESGRGVLEITPETFPLSPDELGHLQGIARAARCPVSFSAILDLPDRPDVWDAVFSNLREGFGHGARVFPQVSCRPMRFDFDLVTGCASLDALPCWRRFRAAAEAERLALLADAAFRTEFRAQTIGRPDSPSSRRWETAVLEESSHPEHQRWIGRSLAEVARERGTDVAETLLDLGRDGGLDARFSMVILNFDEPRVGALLREPESLIALSDAGAHLSVLCDAGYATYLLGHWVRERALYSWEEAVRRLTSMPAGIYGIPNRGRLVPGAVADVVCFDPHTVGMVAPERVRDLPADAERYVARATGIERVFVAGEELLVNGEWTGAHPGRVIDPNAASS